MPMTESEARSTRSKMPILPTLASAEYACLIGQIAESAVRYYAQPDARTTRVVNSGMHGTYSYCQAKLYRFTLSANRRFAYWKVEKALGPERRSWRKASQDASASLSHAVRA